MQPAMVSTLLLLHFVQAQMQLLQRILYRRQQCLCKHQSASRDGVIIGGGSSERERERPQCSGRCFQRVCG